MGPSRGSRQVRSMSAHAPGLSFLPCGRGSLDPRSRLRSCSPCAWRLPFLAAEPTPQERPGSHRQQTARTPPSHYAPAHSPHILRCVLSFL